ncbi:LCP family glycopolymer transferase [[Actinomadura] parvosata]|uniref:LCP family glycopolymer transferase n=1 Tax=[Actinomadura] parvosata TaxID=1955412 RepID=UPI00406CF8FB
MTNRDGVDTAPEGRKRRPTRRPRPDSGSHGAPSADAGAPAGPGTPAPGKPAPGKSGGPGAGKPGRPGPEPAGAPAPDASGAPGKLVAGTPSGRTAKPGKPGKAGKPASRPAKARSGSGAPRFAKPLTPASMLGWTALSAVAPGAAHLRAGRRRTGLVLLSLYAVLLLGAVAFGLTVAGDLTNAAFLADDTSMVVVVVIAAALALAWFAVVVTSYVALRPNRLHQQGQVLTGIVVGVLCVAVMSPFALTANYVLAARDAVGSIFKDTPEPGEPQVTHNPENPWGDRDRVNFLLIGGDAAGNRTGVRTDSMNVASVDLKTGATVLFSLPRNLQHVRFPASSPLHKQFPNGFMAELPNGGLLNEVWQYANDNPQLMGGKNRGPRALMDAIGYTLGLKIDYYMLMNMYGFADLVDAIGGLKIRVEQDVKWGGLYGTAGTIKAGYRKLSGEEALWYGRSRVGSDDFSRMSRQRCVIGAFAQQATPAVILARFEKIAGAAKRLAQTNIPRSLVQPLVELAVKVKDARITSLQFVPPEFYSGRPDWAKIRTATKKALNDSLRPARRAQTANVSASPSVTGATPARTRTATPTQTPTRNTQKAGAQSLDELCGL